MAVWQYFFLFSLWKKKSFNINSCLFSENAGWFCECRTCFSCQSHWILLQMFWQLGQHRRWGRPWGKYCPQNLIELYISLQFTHTSPDIFYRTSTFCLDGSFTTWGKSLRKACQILPSIKIVEFVNCTWTLIRIACDKLMFRFWICPCNV